jgi:bifunctional non-homologous end joining protein LigD
MLQIFDVLHLDGSSTRRLPYRERRALLHELAPDGLAWRTPASIVVQRAEDFVARVEELGLEGAVAKRLDPRYAPGRHAAPHRSSTSCAATNVCWSRKSDVPPRAGQTRSSSPAGYQMARSRRRF